MTSDTLPEQQLIKIIEGLLFVAHEPVTINHLASSAKCSTTQIENALQKLKEACTERGVRLQQQGKKVQLVSAPELADYLERFLGLTVTTKFSTPALETLAIVAYRQPITRPQIEAIRGVNSDGVLRTLISKGLVEDVGRLESVGHPVQFGTTFEFLRHFGIESLDDLPELGLPQIEFPKAVQNNISGSEDETTDKESIERETTGKETTGKETTDKETTDKETTD